MATRESNDGQIQLPRMGGLNERPAPNALPAPDFDICQGLYPARDGLLQRLEGMLLRAQHGVRILNLAQLDDGTGNIVVQDSLGNETIYTLNELFGRPAPESNLVDQVSTEEDSMSTAIILQKEVATTPGGNLDAFVGAAVLNTYYTQRLTDLTVNQDGIVTTFSNWAAGVNPNTWVLGTGSYRIRVDMTFGPSYSIPSFATGVFTVTTTSPAVFTLNSHQLVVGDALEVRTTGTLPTGLVASNTYYVIAAGLTANTFQVSSTPGGAAVNTSGTQSGVHSFLPKLPNYGTSAAVYNETAGTVSILVQPTLTTNRDTNPASNIRVSHGRNVITSGFGRVTIASPSRFSVKAAVNSDTKVNWANDVNCRGFSHGITALLGGAIPENIYTTITIVKET